MKRTSSRSVKATPKVEPAQATNGTPPTDQPSETISEDSRMTRWTAMKQDGAIVEVEVHGGRGRISYSRGSRGNSGEVRIYRNESTKTFDAVLTDVEAIFSDRVHVNIIKNGIQPKDSWAIDEPNPVPMTMAKSTFFRAWADLEPTEQDIYIDRADGDVGVGQDLYTQEVNNVTR